MTEYNKVVYDGQTLIDLTNDDVTESDVLAGVYFHKADGTRSVGTLNVVDYVVEQGTSGNWTFRKWASGVAECWAHTTSGTFAPTGTSGGISYRILSLSFPSGLFNVAPSAHCDTKWGTGVSWASARTLSIATLEFVVCKLNSSSEPADFYHYAIGTWK